ncbi:hypothetical protein B0H14DRAFT_1390538 [Mycena olivaceomarginata]|nr:hypothetical protein B0H14DRAFT_1390538 [Mycena olivaceomarginata]
MAPNALEAGWILVFPEIIGSVTALFFNGICVLLTLLACYFLRCQRPSGYRVLICAMAVLCVFGLAQMIEQVVFTAILLRLMRSAGVVEASAGEHIYTLIQHEVLVKSRWDSILSLINTFVVELYFIYRCYAVWSQSRYKGLVIGLPLLLLLFSTIFGITMSATIPILTKTDSLVAAFTLFATNFLLTALTAGRIWCARRNLQVIGGTTLVRRCNTAITMLLEPGVLYIFGFLVYALAICLGDPATTSKIAVLPALIGASKQVMNTIPALVIVRVSLARSVDTNSTAGDLKQASTGFYGTRSAFASGLSRVTLPASCAPSPRAASSNVLCLSSGPVISLTLPTGRDSRSDHDSDPVCFASAEGSCSSAVDCAPGPLSFSDPSRGQV